VPDIKIHREHRLGLARAREIAWQWAEEVESKFDMDCTVVEGEYSDTVEFVRSGVKGRLIVADDHFDLHAQLGFLLGAFSKTIENEIQKNLDALLAGAQAQDAAAPAAPAKAAARAAGKTAAKAGAKAAAKAPAKAAAAATRRKAG
jgi:putative polyhydroxyalkanoate system protein